MDHILPFSKRLDNGAYMTKYCDGTSVWEGQDKARATEDYNDPANLRHMCSEHNSSRGGKRGYDRNPPRYLGTHDDYCGQAHNPGNQVLEVL